MPDPVLLGLVLGLLVVLLLFTQCRRPGNYPPGPKGLPLVGYIPFFSKHDPKPYKAMLELGKIYGPVTGIYVGPSQLLVSVCGYEAVRQALNNDDLNARPDSYARRERSFGKRLGLIMVDGPLFREQRRFTARHLRELGFGKTSMEDSIHEEIRDLIELIRKQSKSNPKNIVDFEGIFNFFNLNVLWTLIGGERFSLDDARVAHLLDIIAYFHRHFKPLTSSLPVPKCLLQIFPWLRKTLGVRNDIFQPLQDFIRTTIREHAKDRSDGDVPRDFIDVYLKEMEKQQLLDSQTTFHEEQLISSIIDLFLGGAETASNAIGFLILYLLHYPNVQSKMQSELDEICGDSLPSFSHRPRLVYTEAVIWETLRMACIDPFTLMHYASKETKLCGYTIPQGSLVLANIYSVNMDETYWTDPHEFRPERHLDAEGLRFIKSEHVMPFGSGQRMCLGEPLARNTLFLFTAALVKTFQFSFVPDSRPPTMEPLVGASNRYQGFQAMVTPRL